EERLPALISAVRELESQERAGLRPLWLADQPHASLSGRATPLADVAFEASADDILPVRQAAAAPRQNVVEAQLGRRGPLAAILTAIAVPREDVAAVEFHFLARQAVVSEYADDARDLNLEVDGANIFIVRTLEERAGLGDLAPALEVERHVSVVIDG